VVAEAVRDVTAGNSNRQISFQLSLFKLNRHSRPASIDFRSSDPNTDIVRRIAGSILLMAFFFAGSGLASYVHQLDHLGGAVSSSPAKVLGTAETGHDESNCSICLNLHAPALASSVVPIFICVGIFFAFLTQLAPLLLSQRTLARIDCRGPPRR